MKDEMQKDRELEQEFREYFDGNAAPQCDLTYAKRALATPAAPQAKKPRRWIAAVVSACASAAAVFILCLTLIPYLLISSHTYVLENTAQNVVGSAQVRELYAEQVQPFSPFERAENATCAYSIVQNKGEDVLLRADISYYSTETRFDATVYIDLTEGKYKADDFKGYSDLSNTKYGFRYETSFDEETGSHLSRIFVERKIIYYVTLRSDQPQALTYFLEYLKNYF